MYYRIKLASKTNKPNTKNQQNFLLFSAPFGFWILRALQERGMKNHTYFILKFKNK